MFLLERINFAYWKILHDIVPKMQIQSKSIKKIEEGFLGDTDLHNFYHVKAKVIGLIYFSFFA